MTITGLPTGQRPHPGPERPTGRALSCALRLRDGVELAIHDDEIRLTGPGRVTRLRTSSPEARDLFARIGTESGLPLEETGERAHASPTFTGLVSRVGHLTARWWSADGSVVMVSEQLTRHRGYEPAGLDDDQMVRLSRFAVLRRRADALVLECPLSVHRFVLVGDLAGDLAVRAATPRTVKEVVDGCAHPHVARAVLEHWAGAGILEASVDGTFASDDDPAQLMWDVHDLLMHSRSRSGRFDEPLGALSPYRGRVDPLPAVLPPRPDAVTVVPLARVAGTARGLALSEALESRRSIRDYAEAPVTLDELGELLHRTFRTRARYDPADAGAEAKISRPYPSGGGLYEHELYLTVRRCDGLHPGIYRYDGAAHCVELVNADPKDRREMLALAAAATGHPAEPDLLITLTARFGRMAWRYRSIAYANTLRTTGAIYQSLYLVATDLDLAPCALGNGDADLSARVLGLDYLRESSVGDFILGRRRAEDVVTGAPPPEGWTLLDPGPRS